MIPLVTYPCNPCVNGGCGSCVGDRLERAGHIGDAKIHCGCAAKNHKNDIELKLPKVKSMLGRQKEERDIPVNREISVEEEVEIERD